VGNLDTIIRRLLIAAALLGVALPLVAALFRLRKIPATPRIDARYAAARAAVADAPTVGYVSDIAEDGPTSGGLWRTQYGLAPHLLVDGKSPPLIVANLQHARDLKPLCRREGLTPVMVDGTVAVLRAAGEP